MVVCREKNKYVIVLIILDQKFYLFYTISYKLLNTVLSKH